MPHLVDLVRVHKLIEGRKQLIQVCHNLVRLDLLAHGGKAHDAAGAHSYKHTRHRAAQVHAVAHTHTSHATQGREHTARPRNTTQRH